MIVEMQALEKNDTRELVVLPKSSSCKWVFTTKHNPNGSIQRKKARLIAKGYTQAYGIDHGTKYQPLHSETAYISGVAAVHFIGASNCCGPYWPPHSVATTTRPYQLIYIYIYLPTKPTFCSTNFTFYCCFPRALV